MTATTGRLAAASSSSRRRLTPGRTFARAPEPHCWHTGGRMVAHRAHTSVPSSSWRTAASHRSQVSSERHERQANRRLRPGVLCTQTTRRDASRRWAMSGDVSSDRLPRGLVRCGRRRRRPATRPARRRPTGAATACPTSAARSRWGTATPARTAPPRVERARWRRRGHARWACARPAARRRARRAPHRSQFGHRRPHRGAAADHHVAAPAGSQPPVVGQHAHPPPEPHAVVPRARAASCGDGCTTSTVPPAGRQLTTESTSEVTSSVGEVRTTPPSAVEQLPECRRRRPVDGARPIGSMRRQGADHGGRTGRHQERSQPISTPATRRPTGEVDHAGVGPVARPLGDRHESLGGHVGRGTERDDPPTHSPPRQRDADERADAHRRRPALPGRGSRTTCRAPSRRGARSRRADSWPRHDARGAVRGRRRRGRRRAGSCAPT